MKNKFLKYTTIIGSLLLTQYLSAERDYGTIKYIDNHYISVGMSYLDFEAKEFNVKHDAPAFEIGYGYRFNRYFEIGTSIIINAEDKINSNFVDYSVDVNTQTGVPILTEKNTTYKNSIESTFFTTLNFKASYPIHKNFDIYGTIGATYGNIEKTTYYNQDNLDFVDNTPYGTTPAEYLIGVGLGLNDCQLTGNETTCGFGVKERTDKINDISASYGIGLRWKFFDSWGTQIVNFGYTSLMDIDEVKADSLYVNYEFHF
jgi:opacity protein-like surface antigen